MTTKLMQRGRTQTLFTFLPGKTFDYEGGHSICRVTTFEYEENQKLNKEWVLADLRKYLRAWNEPEGRPARLQYFPDPINNKDNYVLAEPTKVLCEVFPLTFECRKCRRITVYNSPEQAAAKGLACRICGGTLQQVYHIQVHTCGHIQALTPPSCPRHGRNHIMLDDRGSQVYANFRWVCRACGDRELPNPLTVDCPQCAGNPNMPKDQLRMRPAVHRAGSTFYPHVRTLVNLPDATLNQLLQDQEYRWLMVAAYLGFVEPGRLLDLARGEAGTGMDQHLAAMEAMMRTMPPEQRTAVEAQFNVLKAQFQAHGSGQRDQAIARVKALLMQVDDDSLTDLAKELVEYVRPGVPLTTRKLADLKNDAMRASLTERLTDYAQYPKEWSALGIREIQVVQDFPLTTAVIGYTRVIREPERETNRGVEKSWLHSFPTDHKGRTPLYVTVQDAEALILHLNHPEVVRWLMLNKKVTAAPDLNDDTAVKAWLLQNVRSVDSYQEKSETPEVTQEVFSLVHSMSHALLRHAVTFCGFDPTSLSEYLFPRALSFVIYANSLQGFTIGGLHTLFEQSLHKWLRDTAEMGRICVYDPVCAEEESACHACMHTSEVSCTHFNRWLGRRFLFGGANPDGSEYIGFWDPRVRLDGNGGVGG